MFQVNSLSAMFCLSLALGMWQGSSCHSSNSDKNGRSTGNENHSMNNNSGAQGTEVKGLWGGDGITMTVTDNGAEIGYACAHGTISEKIVPDARGHFSARGRHVRERPGPSRVNEDQNGQAATYQGSVSGETMNLTVILSDSNETVGTFILTQGRSVRIRRCG